MRRNSILLYLGTALLSALVLYLLLWKVPQWVATERVLPDNTKELFNIENETRKTLAQIVGGLALLLGLWFTARTQRIVQEGQITERFNKAISHLGSTDTTTQLGGVYALERIARDSPRDHDVIVEILTTFVREKSAWDWKVQGVPSSPSIVVQAILTVIGRRARIYKQGEKHRLNLRWVNLLGIDLTGAHLEGADLSGAFLGKACLAQAHLRWAILSRANLTEAECQQADLRNVDLLDAVLRKAELQGALLNGTSTEKANLEGIKNLKSTKSLKQ